MKKRRKHLLKIALARKKDKKKNINGQNKDLRIYSYKCGHKNIKLTVQKIELLKNAALDSIFYYHCTFCGKDFDQQVQACPDCSRPLVKINLKPCPQCGAKNNPLKASCWICSAPFPKIEEIAQKESRLLLTLDLDGVIYRNTDQTQTLGLKKLFDDLVATHFSKEPLEAWLKVYAGDLDEKKELLKEEYRHLLQESRQNNFLWILILVLFILIIILVAGLFWLN